MGAEGFQLALLFECSSGNFYGGLKNIRMLNGSEQIVADRILCYGFGCGANSATRHYFGRIAGFTNRKEKHFNWTIRRGRVAISL